MRDRVSNEDPLLEQLESRTLLSGNVAAYAAGDSLLILGDSQGNSIVIENDASPSGRLVIAGDDTTINGKAEVKIPQQFKRIFINLKGGEDTVVVRKVTLAGNLVIHGGNQSETVRLQEVSLNRSLLVKTHDGDDTIDVSDSTIKGRTEIHTGDGQDAFSAGGSTFAGKFSLAAGKDDDSIYLGDSVFGTRRIINAGPGQNIVTPEAVSLQFDFRRGALGWKAGFADYHIRQRKGLETEKGIRQLPVELEEEGTGFYIKGKNISDDLFMYLTKELGIKDGLKPNQSYQVRFVIRFASNAPSGAMGVGGAPGESVWLKAGATTRAPRDVITDKFVSTSFDHGQQAAGGTSASLVGPIANGNTDLNTPYVSLVREHVHTAVVRTDAKGRLYLVVGTDSGFESTTALYYQQIDVQLVPVTQDSQEKMPETPKPGNPGDADAHPV